MAGTTSLLLEEILNIKFIQHACGYWQGIALKWLTQYEKLHPDNIASLNKYPSKKDALHTILRLLYADLTGEDILAESYDEHILIFISIYS